MLMAIIPIVRDHKIVGIPVGDSHVSDSVPTLRTDGNCVIINTAELGKDIQGFAGTVPVEIYLRQGIVDKVVALPNEETPKFFEKVLNSGITDAYEGLSTAKAAALQVDAVSGATYSSNALIANIKTGLNYALYNDTALVTENESETETPGVVFYATLLVVLAGATLPLLLRGKKYRYIQLGMNVLVLGFWGGTFLSYTFMVSALTNGIGNIILVPAAIMLVTAFIYPLFGRVDHYCNWICPYGSLQELAGKCIRWKIPVSKTTAKWLTVFRLALWFVLMWFLWTGLWYDWMGYESFAAFFFGSASIAVLVIAGIFVLLSFFVQRPYCRFVCPTGSLFKLSEGSKH